MMYAVGLMSGTSFDGIDAALVKIHEDEKRHITYDLIHFITKPFKEGIKEEIECAISLDQSNVQLICSLNFKLGYELAEAVKLTCEEANFPLDKLDFVASHGQTIWHNPDVSDSFVPSTLQIGESAIIAYETNCQVISNFRVMDVAAGGQGAPLVAYTDYIIYRDHEKNVVLQNIGGIANLTYIPKEKLIDDVIAFDTGPGNMMLDYMTRTYFNVPYDRDGQIARKGRVIPKLLKELMDDPYIKKKPPVENTSVRNMSMLSLHDIQRNRRLTYSRLLLILWQSPFSINTAAILNRLTGSFFQVVGAITSILLN